MSPPITTWPGQQPQPTFADTFARTPMFAGYAGPRYTGPFNMPGPVGQTMQMATPFLMNAFPGRMPSQFSPEQNIWDQMQANQHYMATQQAMAIARNQDIAALQSSMGGITQMMTGRPLTAVQSARNYRVAEGVSTYLPLLTNILGPDMIDQLHGSRGSATVFANQLHQAMRTGLDPITRGQGYTASSSGRVTQEVYDRLFGPNANLLAMRGMSAGQAGMLVGEMQSRGLLGTPFGALSVGEQRNALSRQLSSSTINSIAETLPEIRGIIDRGGRPTETMLEQARARVRETNRVLTDPTVSLTSTDIERMPGGQEILRTADAQRISEKLKNLAGAVRAMRDIFGDNGNPNAPMREIINGLDMLSQGGLAKMSPGQLEMMVRRAQNVAASTGVGLQGLMGLTGQNAELARQLNIDPVFAAQNAMRSANFGAAAGDRLRLDIPTWGALTKEELTLADTQLRMHAAASPMANQFNALLRMSDTGMLQTAKGSELDAIVQAVRSGQTTYSYNGETKSTAMSFSKLAPLLQSQGGVGQNTAYGMLADVRGNQEYGALYGTDVLVRRLQSADAAGKLTQPAIGASLRGMLGEQGVSKLLQSRGVIGSEQEFRAMLDSAAAGVNQDFLAMDSATVRTQGARDAAIGASVRTRLAEQIRRRMPGASDAEVQAVVSDVVSQMGGEGRLAAAGGRVYAAINAAAGKHALYRTGVGFHNLNNPAALAEAEARDRMAEANAMMQSSLSGLGTSDPIRRLMDSLQVAGPDTKLTDVLSDALGFQKLSDIAARDPNGVVAETLGLVKSSQKLDPRDLQQFAQMRQNAGMIRGLIDGGDSARAQLAILDGSRDANGNLTIGNEKLYQLLKQSADGKSVIDVLKNMGAMVGATVSKDDIAAAGDNGRIAAELLSAAPSAESGSAIKGFMSSATDVAMRMLNDQTSMEQQGAGGISRVRGILTGAGSIEDILRAEQKRLGKAITVEDLLRGTNGVSPDASAKARASFGDMRTGLASVQQIRNMGTMPGTGVDGRAAMTAAEREELSAMRAFAAMGSVDDRAKNAADRLIGMLSPEAAARMRVGSNYAGLVRELADGDRSINVDQAIRSREGIVRMAIGKGLFGKKSLGELTAMEKAKAAALLQGSDLSTEERTELGRLMKDSGGLLDMGTVDPSGASQDTLRRIRQFGGQAAPADAATPPELKVTVQGGHIELREDGTADLALDGRGLLNQVLQEV